MSRENWWLDFVEGELDPATRRQMKAAMKYSQADSAGVEAFREIKTLLTDNKPEVSEISDDYFEHLHDQIMAKVAKTEMQKAPLIQVRIPRRRWMLKASSLSGLSLLTLLLAVSLNQQNVNTEWNVSDQMAQEVHENLAEMQQLMPYQNDHDFFVDVASQSFDHLTREQVESLVR